MEIDRDWGSWTGSLLEGSLANSLMKTADESRSGKPDKKRMVPQIPSELKKGIITNNR